MRKILLILVLLTAILLALWGRVTQEESSRLVQVQAAPSPTTTLQRIEDHPANDEIVRLAATPGGVVPADAELAVPAPGLLHQFGVSATSIAPPLSTRASSADSVLVKKTSDRSASLSTPDSSSENQSPDNPAVAALKELEGTETPSVEKSGMIPGIVVRSTAAPSEPTARAELTPTAAAARYQRVVGQPRGYAMLYLMHPRARQTVEREVQTMLRSEVGDLYLSALVDGTFGVDWDYLEQVIRRLVVEGRTLTLALYLSNGPTMRKFNKTPIVTPFSRIDPTEFRYLIQVDSEMQGVFKDTTISANRIFGLNKQLNVLNQNIAIVMLEDNLDQQSYRWMRKLAREVLAEDTLLIRNPCPGCWKGNDTSGVGDPIEMHDPADLPGLVSGDGYTLDGAGFRYPNEAPDEQLSIDEVKGLIDLGLKQSLRFFGLWRKQRQGLGQPLTHPDDRNYEVLNAQQEAQEIELLRYGLNPLR